MTVAPTTASDAAPVSRSSWRLRPTFGAEASQRTFSGPLRQRRLRAVKRGVTLLVLMDSIREHMASLPPATFGAHAE